MQAVPSSTLEAWTGPAVAFLGLFVPLAGRIPTSRCPTSSFLRPHLLRNEVVASFPPPCPDLAYGFALKVLTGLLERVRAASRDGVRQLRMSPRPPPLVRPVRWPSSKCTLGHFWSYIRQVGELIGILHVAKHIIPLGSRFPIVSCRTVAYSIRSGGQKRSVACSCRRSRLRFVRLPLNITIPRLDDSGLSPPLPTSMALSSSTIFDPI